MASSKSFENFLSDLTVSAFYCKDWVNECLSALDDEVSGNLFIVGEHQRRALRAVFNRMVETIQCDVCLTGSSGPQQPTSVSFHRRFGWVVEAKELKAFLGKISLLEGTKLTIGHRSYFSGPSVVRGGGDVKIGAYCSIAEGAYINSFRDFHPMSHPSTVNFQENARLREDGLDMAIDYSEFHDVQNQIVIGNDVWIGRNNRISYDAIIGDGCVIAEHSLVRRDCEPYGIFAGIPAKRVRYRFSEDVRSQLLELQWWDWPYERILRNRDFFATLLTDFDGKIGNHIV